MKWRTVIQEPGREGLDDLQSHQTEDGAQIQEWILTQDQIQGSDRQTRPKNYAEEVTRKSSVRPRKDPRWCLRVLFRQTKGCYTELCASKILSIKQ